MIRLGHIRSSTDGAHVTGALAHVQQDILTRAKTGGVGVAIQTVGRATQGYLPQRRQILLGEKM